MCLLGTLKSKDLTDTAFYIPGSIEVNFPVLDLEGVNFPVSVLEGITGV